MKEPSKDATISCLEILLACVKKGDLSSSEYISAKELLSLLLAYLENLQKRKNP